MSSHATGLPSASGVLLTIETRDGEVCLVISDVSIRSDDPAQVRVERLFTEVMLPKDPFLTNRLERRVLEDIGFNVTNRLNALWSVGSGRGA
jgi:hypothetical protein